MAPCTLRGMDETALATVIPFPLHRRGHRPDEPAEPEALTPEEYWQFVQRLAAERRDLRDSGR